MLEMSQETIKDEEKSNILQTLIGIAESIEPINYDDEERIEIENIDEDQYNIRADAADILVRVGDEPSQQIGARILRELGRDKSRLKTLYTDRQNVHDTVINKTVNEFVDYLIKRDSKTILPFAQVHSEITSLIYNSNFSRIMREKCFSSLNRISIDTATFTIHKVTLADVLANVWDIIKNHTEKENNKFYIREELEKRLLEELIDMSGTCSTGYFARLINVLSEHDFKLTISGDEQLQANIAARLNARIKDIKDEDLKGTILLGMMNDADKEDKEAFVKFVLDEEEAIRKELYTEFVINWTMPSEHFERQFKFVISKFVI